MVGYALFTKGIQENLNRELCEKELEFVQWLYKRYAEEQNMQSLCLNTVNELKSLGGTV